MKNAICPKIIQPHILYYLPIAGKHSYLQSMQFVPSYLKGHVIENITEYEVHNAPVGGWEIARKALSADQAAAMGLQMPDVAGKMYPVEMANILKDRHRERFTPEVLMKYATDINTAGASMNFGHDSHNLIGHVMKGSAKVENGILKGVVFIDDMAVMPKQPSMSVNHAIKAGTVSDVSVEVSGTLRVAEKDGEGYATVWEYFIDPERPERTEFHGLALVMRGAQIGAALTVKALGAVPEPQKAKSISKNMKEPFIIDGKKHLLTGKVDNGDIVLDADSLKGLESAITELETKAATAATKEADAVAKAAASETIIADLRAPFEADIVNFEKALNVPTAEALTADAIKALAPAELIAKANALRAKVDAGSTTDPKTQAPASFTNPYL